MIRGGNDYFLRACKFHRVISDGAVGGLAGREETNDVRSYELLIDPDSDHLASMAIKCGEIRGGLKITWRSTSNGRVGFRWILYALIVLTQQLSVTLRSIAEQQTCRRHERILMRKSIADFAWHS